MTQEGMTEQFQNENDCAAPDRLRPTKASPQVGSVLSFSGASGGASGAEWTNSVGTAGGPTLPGECELVERASRWEVPAELREVFPR